MADFSYDDIYEMLRTEKYSIDLQQISQEQMQKIREYLDSKKSLLQKQKESGLFDKTAREHLKLELENARRALRELYERREKKVINRAIFTARSDFKIKDTTNFLAFEEKSYLSLLDILKESHVKFFSNFRAAGVEKVAVPEQEQQASVPQAAPESLPPQQIEPPVNLREINITSSVPQMVGMDLAMYGPFKEADIVKVPEEIASLLLTQGKASEIEQKEMPSAA